MKVHTTHWRWYCKSFHKNVLANCDDAWHVTFLLCEIELQ